MYLFIGFKFYLKDFLAPRLFKTMNEKFNFSCFSYHKCFDTTSAGLLFGKDSDKKPFITLKFANQFFSILFLKIVFENISFL